MAVSILAAPEMDLELIQVVIELLHRTSRPLRVKTGKVMWPTVNECTALAKS